jgi:hemolysin activation/secretion protein
MAFQQHHPFFVLGRRVLLVLASGIFLGTVFVARCQDYERIAPKTPPTSPPSQGLTVPLPSEQGSDAILVSSLKGVVLLSDVKRFRSSGFDGVSGVRIEQLTQFKDARIEPVIEPYLGQPVTLLRLQQLCRDVVVFYRKHDRPIVDVVIPEGQDITLGVVQIVVIEGHLGDVSVTGNRWFETDGLRSLVRIRRGDPIGEKALMQDIDWINANPFLHVDPSIARGGKVGETDLILETKDRFPARFFTGYEDSGNDLTGDERFLFGFNWGDAFLQGHQMNYQFTADSAFEKMTAHSGSYVIPLPWRHTFNVFGSYAKMKGDITDPLFNLTGFSWQASARYGIPLAPIERLKHELSLGFDFKQSNNDLEFGEVSVSGATTEIYQGSLAYHAQYPDPWGETSLDNLAVWSPGRWSDRNRDAIFGTVRAFSSAEYTYDRISLERRTRLPAGLSCIMRGTYQWADNNLLGSEQLGLGGYSTVRGYDEREANGDEGYLTSIELRSPSINPGALIGSKAWNDHAQALVFWDYGCVSNHSLLGGEDPNVLMSSVGPGLRYEITPYLSARFDYGFQLYRTDIAHRGTSRAHLGVVIAY